MAVAIVSTDVWLSHLEFTGGRRETEFGPIDGLFYGVVSGLGDASGGNLTLNGNVSAERKEDWIYILKKVSPSINSTGSMDAFIVAATGPLIPTPTAVANSSFTYGGQMFAVVNNAVTVLNSSEGAGDQFTDLPVFGDKRITGPLALIAAGFETNVDGATYQLSVYGWLIRYQSFFRNVSGVSG